MTTKNGNNAHKMRIAVPRNIKKSLEKELRKAKLDSKIQILDSAKNPQNLMLRYIAEEEDCGRYNFVLRGRSVLMTDEVAAQQVAFHLKDMFFRMYDDCPDEIWTEEQNWKSSVEFMHRDSPV